MCFSDNCTGEYRKVPGNIQFTNCKKITSYNAVESSYECRKLACDEEPVNTVTYLLQTTLCTLYLCQDGGLQVVSVLSFNFIAPFM